MRIRQGQEFYERHDVINKYKYSQTTFDNKSKLGLEKYPTEILNPHKGVWFIHPKRLEEIYKPKRNPNKKNKKGVKQWVISNQWNYIGCVYPRRTTLKENKVRINTIFDEVKKSFRGHDLTLFYSIEPNKKVESKQYSERHTHIHFLLTITTKRKTKPVKQKVKSIIKEYSDTPPFLETYKPQWKNKGKEYTVKELLSYGQGNYDYITFKTKSKPNVR